MIRQYPKYCKSKYKNREAAGLGNSKYAKLDWSRHGFAEL